MQLPQTIEIKGIKVLTTKQIAEAYGVKADIIGYNFRYNKEHYIEGKHYIMLEGQALRDFKLTTVEIQRLLPRVNKLYLWTEKGALLHAKSLNTDKAWEVYDYLVDHYFRTVKENPAPKPHGSLVVDVPVNGQIQKDIAAIRKNISALDVLMDTINKYYSEEDYKKVVYIVEQQGMAIADLCMSLRYRKPQMIYKNL
jgi:hypothetical protein|nr:MAG TPA: hypothetical protein [Caudoviricetes sp.]